MVGVDKLDHTTMHMKVEILILIPVTIETVTVLSHTMLATLVKVLGGTAGGQPMPRPMLAPRIFVRGMSRHNLLDMMMWHLMVDGMGIMAGIQSFVITNMYHRV